VNLEKEYRYVSEQVSHHPPISACWAESPRWHYYGEVRNSFHILLIVVLNLWGKVDAQNKFTGKSFEIRPTGVAHADLILPEEWGPTYPKFDGPVKVDDGKKVVEHYSWKKVTTQVSGFLLGSPTIDHCKFIFMCLTLFTHNSVIRWGDDSEFILRCAWKGD
jgi:oxysterol-binding protein 1